MASLLRELLAGAAAVIPEGELEERLAAGRPLRVKLGIDPSRPDLHLGHAVVLRKLRRFQDLGHTAVLIIGDFTGRVGDPSGQSETRSFLTAEEIEANARTYLEQAGRVLDMDRAEVRRNSEWLAPLTFADVLGLAAQATVARMLERDDFADRYAAGRPISVVEFLYPLMQGYDSVAVAADVEMGGTDQTFNLLMGRDLQQRHGQPPQVVFTMPLLEGTDGVRKMSKSFDNFVGLTEPPEEMFGKLMRVPDRLIPKYLLLCAGTALAEVERVERGLADGSVHPGQAKRAMAGAVVALYHGEEAATAAEARFDTVHVDHEIPADVPERAIPPEVVREGRVWLPRLLAALGLARSSSEVLRLLEQGGVRLDGEQVVDANREFALTELVGRVLQVGRRRFVRLTGPA
ncbi:MAG TPA: tyrosine--tRNA ligase [Actinomycetota bacterium]|nr:tyrosine--tRNA ligase [Actinomycetota bacterium]